jgi:Uma2 family endonuclease
MAQTAPKPWTVEDFLAWEREQEGRHEWYDGFIRAMVGGTIDHHTIALNIAARLHDLLRASRCRAFQEGAKLRSDDAITYPDVVVTCSDLVGTDDVLAEPVVIVEVLSRSTEEFDRGKKWLIYQQFATLRHYVLVTQDAARIEIFSRREDAWNYAILTGLDQSLRLPAIDAVIPFTAIYERTTVAKAG